ncbi:MAG TPA: 50S ribosomal protein L4 [Actinomycetota bacterium]|nr:50S ribosomal protein L4 [Actinomycetota bacterium]
MAETTTKAKKLTAQVIDGTGKSSGTKDLPAEIFGGAINEALLHQVMTAELAEARSGTASTKTRSEVRGGGKKPWRQKGTGRARHGSIRSPQWVGGGRVFGPKPRKYSVKVNKKMRVAALRSALADKANGSAIWVMDGFTETKTKAAGSALSAAGIDGRILIVLDPEDEGSRTVDRAFRNLDKVAFSLQGSLSTYDVLVADAVLFTSTAFDRFLARAKGGRG